MTDTISAVRRGGPVSPTRSALRPLGPDELRITGGFWGDKQELNGRTIIRHCLSWMERIGWIANFDRAAAGTVAEHHDGIEFVDSEVYKLLEAMAWELGRDPGSELEADYHRLVARVAAAQEPDGYLHTSFGRPGQRARYSDLEFGHELYCFGHLFQAAVARVRSGRHDTIVEVARRLAEHVHAEFGPGGRDAVCGHPEIETALVELGRALSEPRYIDLAAVLVERRGRRRLKTTLFQGSDYFLDDQPVRSSDRLRGHAVRAMYLASGAADVAAERGDAELLAAVERQWANTVASRTYITGGVGAHHQNEEFGADLELPPDRAYAETCAAIGSVMLSWRLLLATGESKYADLIERTLYNAILVSPREDGRAFYYANTLHQRVQGTVPADDELSERAESSLRAPWFEVSCCPTNLARTLASVGSYIATATHDGVQLHQLADAELATRTGGGVTVELEMRTNGYPFGGEIVIAARSDGEVEIAVRVPAWAHSARVTHAGTDHTAVDGYVRIRARFAPEDPIRLSLPMEPRFAYPAPGIDAVRGTVAVERGPLVLCAESTGLPEGVHVDEIRIHDGLPLAATPTGARARITVVRSPGAEWPYAPQPGIVSGAEERTLELKPYFGWGNNGPSTMRVFLPRHSA
ncbi:glycoside hydrolase family 127 protein [Leifsonia sp. ZF2019]|uniref:glycoside hydrolase family 127 protein n=1 Tax=Leifsonia sp. ZF2019 TaxID=2781978 RepID=UPI001CBFBF6C|nr:beta-L-arabinofuranosidase domain-containing protein [Leifsonia sp. ZF2019]UAJ80212.1 glycoside hydrolase family 127 protein [Leifsonia sp. ZF2019]